MASEEARKLLKAYESYFHYTNATEERLGLLDAALSAAKERGREELRVEAEKELGEMCGDPNRPDIQYVLACRFLQPLPPPVPEWVEAAVAEWGTTDGPARKLQAIILKHAPKPDAPKDLAGKCAEAVHHTLAFKLMPDEYARVAAAILAVLEAPHA